MAFLLYANTISFDYAQDDSIVIKENMYTQKGLAGLAGIFTKDTFYGFFKKEGKDKLVSGGRYRPASVASFAIEQSLFGNNPSISHAINTLLYAAMSMLLFLTLIRLYDGSFDHKKLENFAWVVALLFAVHPVHTEVVANIKGRDEIFVGLFGLLSIYLLFDRKRSIWKLVLAYIAMLIAFFSKEHAIVYVIIIPLCLWLFTDKRWNKKNMWISSLPIVAMAAFYLVVRAQILGPSLGAEPTELMNNPFLKFDGQAMMPYSFEEKWSTILYNLGKYLQLMIFPYPLTSDYYPYHITAKSFSNIWVILSSSTHVILVLLTAYGIIKKKKWVFGLAVYFGFLFLVSNVPFNIGTNLSERFLFMPSIGFILAIVYLLFTLGLTQRKEWLFALIIVLLLGSFYTIKRSLVWQNDFSLLTTDVQYSNQSAKALHGAAGALSEASVQENDPRLKKDMILQSNTYLDKAIEIYPFYSNAYLIRGNNYYYLEEYEKAIRSYEDLLQMNPEHSNALSNLQITLRDAGRFYGEKKGDLNQGINYLKQAYNMNSKDYETVRLLGISYGVGGNNEEAIRYFKEALSLNDQDAYAWLNIGNAYFKLGDEENGRLHHAKALELDPSLKSRIGK